MDERSELIGPDADGSVPELDPPLEQPRRGFVTRGLAVILGGILGLVPLLAGLRVLLHPLGKKSGEVPFLGVATLDALPADGVPRLFRVIAEIKEDAWNRYLNVPVGAVYLRRMAGSAGEIDTIVAFNTTCPHLGCFVSARADASYYCPCHKSEFNVDGSRGAVCVAPRGLDRLETRVVENEIQVQFQNFHTGEKERVPIA